MQSPDFKSQVVSLDRLFTRGAEHVAAVKTAMETDPWKKALKVLTCGPHSLIVSLYGVRLLLRIEVTSGASVVATLAGYRIPNDRDESDKLEELTRFQFDREGNVYSPDGRKPDPTFTVADWRRMNPSDSPEGFLTTTLNKLVEMGCVLKDGVNDLESPSGR